MTWVETGELRPKVSRELAHRFARRHVEDSRLFHLVLDDGNVGQSSARFVLQVALMSGDDDIAGQRLAALLFMMTRTQRIRLRKLVRAALGRYGRYGHER